MGMKLLRRKQPYNQGDKALWGRIVWFTFVVKYLIVHRHDYRFIHACDLDAVVPALFAKIFFGKYLIFDVFDWFSDTLSLRNRAIRWAISLLEYISVKLSDTLILCETERRDQIPFKINNVLILPNIPMVDSLEMKHPSPRRNEPLRICYVGALYHDRNILELLEACSQNHDVHLVIAGFGSEDIVSACQKYDKSARNIEYLGRVDYHRALIEMGSSNAIYAMYCRSNKNHVWAAPNKYYESLMLGVPLITTEGTLVGNRVKTYGTGFAIREGLEPTNRLLSYLAEHNLDNERQRCHRLWDDLYRDYTEKFFREQYFPLLGAK